mgnify:CR=1 FL=1
MANSIVPYNRNEEGVVIYRTDDNTLQLDVQVADETVWLTQQQMAELFQKDRTVVTRHINNIFSEGELEEESNVHFLHFPFSDKPTKVYNLDVIISVGYRVKSQRGTQFRRWATKIIRNYTLKGYAVNQRLLAVEERMDRKFSAIESELRDHQEKIDFFVRTNVPPVEQVFFEGEFFGARVLLEKLIKTALKRVIIIDAYVDAATFEMLDVRAKGVTADIYSDSEYKSLRDMHNAIKGIQPVNTHKWRTPSHDRWLIIDDSLYHCGHSLKDMGKKLSAITLMGTKPETILKEVK